MLQKSVFIGTVFAKESLPPLENNESAIKKLPRVNELPVYVSLDEIEGYEVVKRSPSSLEKGLSYVRKNTMIYVRTVQGVTKKVEDRCQNVFNQTKNGYEYITHKDNSLPRAIAITSGGLIGFLLGIRGGIVKKVLYTGSGLTTSAAICYPKQAVEICKSGYEWIKENKERNFNEITGEKWKEISSKFNMKLPSMDSFDKISEQVSDIQYYGFRLFNNEENDSFKNLINPQKKNEGDIGQSHPDDKDLYTTRSK